jgi:hypothetical protein
VDEGIRYANARVDLDCISCGGGIGHIHVVVYNTHADPRCHGFSAIEKMADWTPLQPKFKGSFRMTRFA